MSSMKTMGMVCNAVVVALVLAGGCYSAHSRPGICEYSGGLLIIYPIGEIGTIWAGDEWATDGDHAWIRGCEVSVGGCCDAEWLGSTWTWDSVDIEVDAYRIVVTAQSAKGQLRLSAASDDCLTRTPRR